MIWFKEMAGDAYDPIWQQIALDLRLKLSTVIAVRSMLYAQAAIGSNSFSGDYILCPDTLDKLLGEKSGTARRVLAQMEVYGYAQDGRLTKWEQAQGKFDSESGTQGESRPMTATERSRLYRQRQRERNADATDELRECNANATLMQRGRNEACNADETEVQRKRTADETVCNGIEEK